MIGVSPAYFFSLYTTNFSIHDYSKGLEWLKQNDFGGFQLEVFAREKLDEWLSGAELLSLKARDLNLAATQFVAHFLLYSTRNSENLAATTGYDDMKRVLDIVSKFPDCTIITLPLAPFEFEKNKSFSKDEWARLWDMFRSRLLAFDQIVVSGGCKLALEIVPGSLLGGTEGLMHLIAETGNTTIGYNFDTGHAFSSKEAIATLPAKLAGRIYGTHLKDNFGAENLALPPGEGSIPWVSVLDGLRQNGYSGSYDLEIASKSADMVERDYRKGKMTVSGVLDASKYR
jgi:sugar phosphate isomerase/epimerase